MWPAEHCKETAILSLTGGVNYSTPAADTSIKRYDLND